MEAIDQPYCAYKPHVLALFPSYRDQKGKVVETGQKMKVMSTANFGHNTNFTGEGASDNIVPTPTGKTYTFKPRAKAQLVNIDCNVHPQMKAYALVMDNPYYAITNDKGEFEIKNVPPGKVLLFAWHENVYLTPDTGLEIDLTDGENKKDFTLKPSE